MISRTVGIAVVVASAMAGTSGQAEPVKKRKHDPYLDVPRVFEAREAGAASWLWAECKLIPDQRPRRVRCTISQMYIRRKKVDPELHRMATEIEASPKWTKHAATLCKGADGATLPTTPERRDRMAAYVRACKVRDGKALAALLRAGADEEARSCDVTYAPPTEAVYTQSDANTWTNTVDGVCGTIVFTMWRTGPGVEFWNYTQVKSFMPNAPEMCGAASQTPRTDWLWWDRPAVRLGCELFP